MFNILTCVQVAPATADVHIILEVPATDKIHIEGRCSLAELSQTMGYTTRKTVNWFTCKQLHFNYAVPEGTKGAMNLFIKLEKHKLNQIDGRNIRNLSTETCSFLEEKLRLLRRKNRSTWQTTGHANNRYVNINRTVDWFLLKQRLTASKRKWPVRWADVRGEERMTSLRTSA